MKKIITSALVLALTIGAAHAQTTSPEKEKAHKKEHKMHKKDGLNLTEDQKAKMKSLHEEQKKEMQALKENKSATKEQRKELHKKYREQMQSILTPAQKEQMAKMKEERKASAQKGDFKRGKVFGKKGDFKRGGDFQKELGLTQDQKDKMAKIRTDFRSQFESLRNDNNLSKEQKKTKMRDLMKAQQEQMKTVLTKEQIEKMQSLRKERSSKNTK
jgi:Spy/CpxP family protein refolding chaperone